MKYYLMHRELQVAELEIDTRNGSVYSVGKIFEPQHLPLDVGTRKNTIATNLMSWFSGRAIPASRSGFRQMLEDMAVERGTRLSSGKLLVKCFGLSLSDQYWVNPVENPLQWDKINFYDNPFSDDVGDLLFGQMPEHKEIDLFSPCNTSDGWLQKKWKILDGQRVLIKGASAPYQQEAFNEVLASAICRRLNIPHVNYTVFWENGKPYSVCPNMTTNRQDLVTAYAIQSTQNRRNDVSPYAHFMQCCEALGIHDARRAVNQMLVLDFLLCNRDRHYGNFGAIRDAVTLEWQGIAPVYDTGTSMWNDLITDQIKSYADSAARPFRKTHLQQLELVADDCGWIDFTALQGLCEESLAIYEQAHLGEGRAARLSTAVAKRCELLQERIHELQPPTVSVKDICSDAKTKAAELNAEKTLVQPAREREQTE